mgnify:CR=1 FL=1
MNNSAPLYVDALKLIIVVAVDVKFTELVSDLATPPVTNDVPSAPVIAYILAPLCGAEVNVMFVPDTVKFSVGSCATLSMYTKTLLALSGAELKKPVNVVVDPSPVVDSFVKVGADPAMANSM